MNTPTPDLTDIVEFRVHLNRVAPSLTTEENFRICRMAINYASNFANDTIG